jgi:hypothetical protein
MVSEVFGAEVLARVLLMLHLGRRVYECRYIQQYNDASSKMHVAGYFLGIGHYLVLPLVFWNVTGPTNHVMDNDPIQDNVDKTEWQAFYPSSASLQAAAMVFLVCSNLYFQYEQHRHHVILASLRSDKRKRDHDTSIPPTHHSLPPKRGLFRWILCPHYLAEIFFYLSLAFLLELGDEMMRNSTIYDEGVCEQLFTTWIHLGLLKFRRYRHWMLVIWVTTNLTVSALNSYDWYQQRYYSFGPGKIDNINCSTIERKAIVPFLL